MIKKIGLNIFNAIGGTRILRAQKKNKITGVEPAQDHTGTGFFFKPIIPAHFELLLKYVTRHYNVITIGEIHSLTNIQEERSKTIFDIKF
jgi:hypothetical protein